MEPALKCGLCSQQDALGSWRKLSFLLSMLSRILERGIQLLGEKSHHQLCLNVDTAWYHPNPPGKTSLLL